MSISAQGINYEIRATSAVSTGGVLKFKYVVKVEPKPTISGLGKTAVYDVEARRKIDGEWDEWVSVAYVEIDDMDTFGINTINVYGDFYNGYEIPEEIQSLEFKIIYERGEETISDAIRSSISTQGMVISSDEEAPELDPLSRESVIGVVLGSGILYKDEEKDNERVVVSWDVVEGGRIKKIGTSSNPDEMEEIGSDAEEWKIKGVTGNVTIYCVIGRTNSDAEDITVTLGTTSYSISEVPRDLTGWYWIPRDDTRAVMRNGDGVDGTRGVHHMEFSGVFMRLGCKVAPELELQTSSRKLLSERYYSNECDIVTKDQDAQTTKFLITSQNVWISYCIGLKGWDQANNRCAIPGGYATSPNGRYVTERDGVASLTINRNEARLCIKFESNDMTYTDTPALTATRVAWFKHFLAYHGVFFKPCKGKIVQSEYGEGLKIRDVIEEAKIYDWDKFKAEYGITKGWTMSAGASWNDLSSGIGEVGTWYDIDANTLYEDAHPGGAEDVEETIDLSGSCIGDTAWMRIIKIADNSEVMRCSSNDPIVIGYNTDMSGSANEGECTVEVTVDSNRQIQIMNGKQIAQYDLYGNSLDGFGYEVSNGGSYFSITGKRAGAYELLGINPSLSPKVLHIHIKVKGKLPFTYTVNNTVTSPFANGDSYITEPATQTRLITINTYDSQAYDYLTIRGKHKELSAARGSVQYTNNDYVIGQQGGYTNVDVPKARLPGTYEIEICGETARCNDIYTYAVVSNDYPMKVCEVTIKKKEHRNLALAVGDYNSITNATGRRLTISMPYVRGQASGDSVAYSDVSVWGASKELRLYDMESGADNHSTYLSTGLIQDISAGSTTLKIRMDSVEDNGTTDTGAWVEIPQSCLAQVSLSGGTEVITGGVSDENGYKPYIVITGAAKETLLSIINPTLKGYDSGVVNCRQRPISSCKNGEIKETITNKAQDNYPVHPYLQYVWTTYSQPSFNAPAFTWMMADTYATSRMYEHPSEGYKAFYDRNIDYSTVGKAELPSGFDNTKYKMSTAFDRYGRESGVVETWVEISDDNYSTARSNYNLTAANKRTMGENVYLYYKVERRNTTDVNPAEPFSTTITRSGITYKHILRQMTTFNVARAASDPGTSEYDGWLTTSDLTNATAVGGTITIGGFSPQAAHFAHPTVPKVVNSTNQYNIRIGYTAYANTSITGDGSALNTNDLWIGSNKRGKTYIWIKYVPLTTNATPFVQETDWQCIGYVQCKRHDFVSANQSMAIDIGSGTINIPKDGINTVVLTNVNSWNGDITAVTDTNGNALGCALLHSQSKNGSNRTVTFSWVHGCKTAKSMRFHFAPTEYMEAGTKDLGMITCDRIDLTSGQKDVEDVELYFYEGDNELKKEVQLYVPADYDGSVTLVDATNASMIQYNSTTKKAKLQMDYEQDITTTPVTLIPIVGREAGRFRLYNSELYNDAYTDYFIITTKDMKAQTWLRDYNSGAININGKDLRIETSVKVSD